jgi:hypothetical protein
MEDLNTKLYEFLRKFHEESALDSLYMKYIKQRATSQITVKDIERFFGLKCVIDTNNDISLVSPTSPHRRRSAPSVEASYAPKRKMTLPKMSSPPKKKRRPTCTVTSETISNVTNTDHEVSTFATPGFEVELQDESESLFGQEHIQPTAEDESHPASDDVEDEKTADDINNKLSKIKKLIPSKCECNETKKALVSLKGEITKYKSFITRQFNRVIQTSTKYLNELEDEYEKYANRKKERK